MRVKDDRSVIIQVSPLRAWNGCSYASWLVGCQPVEVWRVVWNGICQGLSTMARNRSTPPACDMHQKAGFTAWCLPLKEHHNGLCICSPDRQKLWNHPVGTFGTQVAWYDRFHLILEPCVHKQIAAQVIPLKIYLNDESSLECMLASK